MEGTTETKLETESGNPEHYARCRYHRPPSVGVLTFTVLVGCVTGRRAATLRQNRAAKRHCATKFGFNRTAGIAKCSFEGTNPSREQHFSFPTHTRTRRIPRISHFVRRGRPFL